MIVEIILKWDNLSSNTIEPAIKMAFRLQPVYRSDFLKKKNPQKIPKKGTFEGSVVAGVRLELTTFGL